MKNEYKGLLAGIMVGSLEFGNLLTAYAGELEKIDHLANYADSDEIKPVLTEQSYSGEFNSVTRLNSLTEVDQLLEEIDRISNYTDFGGIAPLPGMFPTLPTEQSDVGKCNVEVSQGQSFSVTIPAFISMNGEKNNKNINSAVFKTVVKADIAGGDSITVEPAVMSFKMKESGGIKTDLTANITVDEKGWTYEIDPEGDTEETLKEGIEREHTISVKNLSAGRWTGIFNWNIVTSGDKIDDSLEHVDYKTYRNENGKLVEDVEQQ